MTLQLLRKMLNVKALSFVSLISVCSASLVAAPASQTISATLDSPTPLEQNIVAEINRVRSNPAAYAAELQKLRQYYDGNMLKLPGTVPLLTNEGVKALDEAIQAVSAASPTPTHTRSVGMSKAARDLVNVGGLTKDPHTGKDGSTMSIRLNRYGKWQVSAAENISFGSNTAKDVVRQLIIDDGVASRGHRTNILKPNFRVTGVGCGSDSTFGKYGTMCVMDFANGYTE